MTTLHDAAAPEPGLLAYTIRTLAAATGASENAIYLDIRSGLLESFIVGKRHLISRAAAERWLEARARGKRVQANAKLGRDDWDTRRRGNVTRDRRRAKN